MESLYLFAILELEEIDAKVIKFKFHVQSYLMTVRNTRIPDREVLRRLKLVLKYVHTL